MIGAVTGLVALPAVVLGVSALGGEIDPRLIRAMWIGSAILFVLLIGTVTAFVRDEPWRFVARVIARVRHWVRSDTDHKRLARRMLTERDRILSAVHDRLGWVLFVDFGWARFRRSRPDRCARSCVD